MHRFFVAPTVLSRQPVTLTGDQAHQVRRVLRLRPGDRVALLDGQGNAYEAALIAAGERDAQFEIVRHWKAGGEPAVHVTLYQAVLKGERFAWTLQKGTEIGVSRFVPLICERNVVDDLRAVEGKRERWERIIQEAAEQSGRATIPELASTRQFREALATFTGGCLRLVPWEAEHATRLADALAACNLGQDSRIELVIGPEGGFSEAEIEFARKHGARPVTLGTRILRAETAGLVATAAIMYHAGEF